MARLGEIVSGVRSKNAGPFMLTIDIFCGTPETFDRVRRAVATPPVATILGSDPGTIRRFELPGIRAIKYSLPRPCVQGCLRDRDMHGAQWAILLEEMEIREP